MRNRLVALATAGLLLALAGTPATAITGNYTNDFDHPFVGLAVFYDYQGEFSHRCSGSLVSPTVVVTAGHCTEGVTEARIYFEQDAGAHYDSATEIDPVSGYPEWGGVTGTAHNYGFANFAGFPNIHDVGLVILDQPIAMSEYGELPEAGVLDGLDTARGLKKTIFTSSGYGLTYRTAANSAVPNISYRSRLMAISTLVNLTSNTTDGYNLQTQGNGDDRGGTCSGDSGGPVFLGGPESNLIVSVTSFGMNSLCRGTDWSYRVDQAEVLEWINSH